MSSLLSSTTLAIVLGTSQTVKNSYSTNKQATEDFPGSPAFTNAATNFKKYLCDSNFFGLPPENLHDLFDANLGSDEVLSSITNWIKQRLARLKEEGKTATILLFYFVGHADFAQRGTLYCLAIQRSTREYLHLNGVPVTTLLDTLSKEEASQLSKILIFDCCYAASAYQQGDEAAQHAIKEAVKYAQTATGKGTYFLCSSGKKVMSFITSDRSTTRFSKALLQVLRDGNPQQPDRSHLSIQEVAELTDQVLRDMLDKGTPRPEYSSVDREWGDIAKLPLFPNLCHPPAPLPALATSSVSKPAQIVQWLIKILKSRIIQWLIMAVGTLIFLVVLTAILTGMIGRDQLTILYNIALFIYIIELCFLVAYRQWLWLILLVIIGTVVYSFNYFFVVGDPILSLKYFMSAVLPLVFSFGWFLPRRRIYAVKH